MTLKKQIGNLGEKLAAEYLEKKGYKIITRNYRVKWGDEIDIIAISPKKVLTFVEVKTIWGSRVEKEAGLEPEDNLTSDKLYKLKRVCQFYANKNSKLVGDYRRTWLQDKFLNFGYGFAKKTRQITSYMARFFRFASPKIKKFPQEANSTTVPLGDRGWQIDLLAIVIYERDINLTELSNDYEVRHYENI